MAKSPWEEATQHWVKAGWVDAAKRAPLQEWLDENRPPPTPSPFLDVALTAVVAIGNWLLIGGLILATSLVIDTFQLKTMLPMDAAATVALVASCLQLMAGGASRAIGAKALAHGFLSSWVLVVVLSTLVLLDAPWRGIALVNFLVVAAPCLLALAIGLWDEQPGLSASAALSILPVFATQATIFEKPAFDVVVVGCALLMAVLVVAARLWPSRGATLSAVVPFATGLALAMLFGHQGLVPAASVKQAWLWEVGGISMAMGLALLAGSAVARSRLVLVSGVAAMLYSEILLLTAIGDVWFAIIALSVEGFALIFGAAGLLIVRSLAAAREAEAGDVVAAPDALEEAGEE